MLYLAYTLWAVGFFLAVMGFGYFFMVLADRAYRWNDRRRARAFAYRQRLHTYKPGEGA